jgi:hypothetical protein
LVDVAVGDRVRLYEGGYAIDGWFWDGTVVDVSDSDVLVDFEDWTERWTIDRMTEIHIHFETVLVPSGRGEIVSDFRLPKAV